MKIYTGVKNAGASDTEKKYKAPITSKPSLIIKLSAVRNLISKGLRLQKPWYIDFKKTNNLTRPSESIITATSIPRTSENITLERP